MCTQNHTDEEESEPYPGFSGLCIVWIRSLGNTLGNIHYNTCLAELPIFIMLTENNKTNDASSPWLKRKRQSLAMRDKTVVQAEELIRHLHATSPYCSD